MADQYITGKNIIAVYDEHQPRYTTSQRKQQGARDLLAGKLRAPLDASILPNEQEREALRASTSQKYMLPLKIMAMLDKKRPEIERFPVGQGPRAMAAATKIEQIDNAVADLIYPHDVVGDNLLNEGACVVVTQPDMTAWDGQPASMFDDPDGMTKLSKRYAVDKQGRGEDDDYYREPGKRRQFKADTSSSAKYFDSIATDFRARNIPIQQNAYSMTEAIVLNPRRKGNRMMVDGMIRKSEWSVSTLLKRGYRWGESGHMEATSLYGSSGASKNATMHELWYVAPNGHVYTSYCVEGVETMKQQRDGSYTDAVIDLTELYGIEQLPVAFDYGLCFPGATSPDDRPVPFVDIFARTWMNLDSATTSLLVRFYRVASLFLAYKPDAALLQMLGITGQDDVPMPELLAGYLTPILGDLQDIHGGADLSEFSALISALKIDLNAELPSPDATGGGKDVSGYGRNVAEADVIGTFQQVTRGKLSLFEQSMGHFNEQAACIGRKHQKVCLFVNQPIPVEQKTTNQSATKAIIEIDPEVFGDVWQVTAKLPVDVDDNMVLAQLLMDAHQKEELPHRFVLEKGFGIPDPENVEAEIASERARKTDLGVAMQLKLAAAIAGDEEQRQLNEAIAAGLLLQLDPTQQANMDNVYPTSATAGTTPPSMRGMGMNNPVPDALGGVMAGGMQAGPQAQSAMIGQEVPVG